MKKLLTILIISLVYNSNIFAAEEIRSRFGFYITVPDKFVAVQDQNMDDLLKVYDGTDLDKKAFNDLMAGVSKNRMNIEYFFPTHLDPASNSFNINIQKGNVAEIIGVGMNNICPYYQKEYSKIFKKNIRQHECDTTKNTRFRNQYLGSITRSNGVSIFKAGDLRKTKSSDLDLVLC